MFTRLLAAAAIVAMVAGCAGNRHGGTQQSQMDIVDTAVSAGSFNTLVAAVQAADLVDTLKSPGPFTVFAPTDAAFAQLPDGTVESLLKPENKDKLVAILTYHVVPGETFAADLAGQQVAVATVQGSTVDIDGTNGVRVDGANVVQADVDASNGVIHVIDKVILPGPSAFSPQVNPTKTNRRQVWRSFPVSSARSWARWAARESARTATIRSYVCSAAALTDAAAATPSSAAISTTASKAARATT